MTLKPPEGISSYATFYITTRCALPDDDAASCLMVLGQYYSIQWILTSDKVKTFYEKYKNNSRVGWFQPLGSIRLQAYSPTSLVLAELVESLLNNFITQSNFSSSE